MAALKKAIEETSAFCREQGIDPQAIQQASIEDFKRVGLIQDAVNALLANDEIKKKYLSSAGVVVQLYKAILPDPAASTFSGIVALFVVMVREIRQSVPNADIGEIVGGIEQLLDLSVAPKRYVIREASGTYDTASHIDLSQIDFDALQAHFANSRKHIEVEKLRGAINSKITNMVRLNKSRANYQEKYQRLIDDYNAGSKNVELLFKELVEIAQELIKEEQRHVAEQLSEEELAMFDMLNEKLPGVYTSEMSKGKCDEIYQHLFDVYYGQGQSLYGKAS